MSPHCSAYAACFGRLSECSQAIGVRAFAPTCHVLDGNAIKRWRRRSPLCPRHIHIIAGPDAAQPFRDEGAIVEKRMPGYLLRYRLDIFPFRHELLMASACIASLVPSTTVGFTQCRGVVCAKGEQTIRWRICRHRRRVSAASCGPPNGVN